MNLHHDTTDQHGKGLTRMTGMWSARQDEMKVKLCSVGAMLDALGNPQEFHRLFQITVPGTRT